MSRTFLNRFRKLSLIICVLGLATVCYAYYVTRKSPPSQSYGFTMFSKMVFTPNGGTPAQVTAKRVRYQASDGSFRQITTYLNPDGTEKKSDTLIGKPGRGVFEINGNATIVNFLSPMPQRPAAVSEAQLRQAHDHAVSREETVLGYKTLVVRIPDGAGSSGYTELYHAIDLQGFPIKTVNVSDAGTMVIEPTNIQTGEPANANLAMPNLAVSYDRFEAKIKALEQSGEVETASKLRQQLADAKKQ